MDAKMHVPLIQRLKGEMKARGIKTPQLQEETGIPKDRVYKWFKKNSKINHEDAIIIEKWIKREEMENIPNIVSEPETPYGIKELNKAADELKEKAANMKGDVKEGHFADAIISMADTLNKIVELGNKIADTNQMQTRINDKLADTNGISAKNAERLLTMTENMMGINITDITTDEEKTEGRAPAKRKSSLHAQTGSHESVSKGHE